MQNEINLYILKILDAIVSIIRNNITPDSDNFALAGNLADVEVLIHQLERLIKE